MLSPSGSGQSAMARRFAKKAHERRPLSDNVLSILQQVLQLISVASSFLWAFYFMHIMYNISAYGLPHWWHYVFMAPLVMNLVVHLPSVISQYSLVQAYYLPDPDVMDATISMAHEVDEDLNFIRRQLDARAGWQEKVPNVINSSADLAKFLKSLDVTFNMDRIKRIFQAIDKDASGQLDAEEFRRAVGV